MRSPGLPFNGRYSRNPCNYMNHYSFTDPGGMEGWVLVNVSAVALEFLCRISQRIFFARRNVFFATTCTLLDACYCKHSWRLTASAINRPITACWSSLSSRMRIKSELQVTSFVGDGNGSRPTHARFDILPVRRCFGASALRPHSVSIYDDQLRNSSRNACSCLW